MGPCSVLPETRKQAELEKFMAFDRIGDGLDDKGNLYPLPGVQPIAGENA
jgi:hypothetical protein